MSQPAVSKHLASLEAELGAELVTRGRKGVELTPAGEVLAEYVLRAEALLANASRALASGEDGGDRHALARRLGDAGDLPAAVAAGALPRAPSRRPSSTRGRDRRRARSSSSAPTASNSPCSAG